MSFVRRTFGSDGGLAILPREFRFEIMKPPKLRLDAFLPAGVYGSARKIFGRLPWSSVGTPYYDVSRVSVMPIRQDFAELDRMASREPRYRDPNRWVHAPFVLDSIVTVTAGGITGGIFLCWLTGGVSAWAAVVGALAGGIAGVYWSGPYWRSALAMGTRIRNKLSSGLARIARRRALVKSAKLGSILSRIDFIFSQHTFYLPPEREAMVLGCSDLRWQTMHGRLGLGFHLGGMQAGHAVFKKLKDELGHDERVAQKATLMWALHALGQDRHLRFENLEADTVFLSDLAETMAGVKHPDISSRMSVDVSLPFTDLLRHVSFYRLHGAPLPEFAEAVYLAGYLARTGRLKKAGELWGSVASGMESGETNSLEKTVASLLTTVSFSESEEDMTVKLLVELQLARIIGKRIHHVHDTLEPGTVGLHAIPMVEDIDRVNDLVSSAEERLGSLDDGIHELVTRSKLADVSSMVGSLALLRSIYDVHSAQAHTISRAVGTAIDTYLQAVPGDTSPTDLRRSIGDLPSQAVPGDTSPTDLRRSIGDLPSQEEIFGMLAPRSDDVELAMRMAIKTIAVGQAVVAGAATVVNLDAPFDLGAEWSWIPPGEFKMGSAEDDPYAISDEKSLRSVMVGGFYMLDHPVTNAEFRAFLKATDRGDVRYFPRKLAGDDQPAVFVNHEEATAYSNWLGEQVSTRTGISVIGRLPSEREWEKAAKGPGGNEFITPATPAQAHFNAGATRAVNHREVYKNGFGLGDVIGNVWEWTSSRYGDGPSMVLRGASWNYDYSRGLRAAFSYVISPGARNYYVGFRPVLAPQGF